MTLVLESRLFDTIRQELGGTYSITAESEIVRFPRSQYAVRIDWTCDPAQTDALVRRVFDEIAAFRDKRFAEMHIELIHETLLRDFEQKSQDNSYFLNEIVRRYKNGDTANLDAIRTLPERIRMLTADEIYDAAQTYLDTARYVKVILAPEQ
jgi:zinc protease